MKRSANDAECSAEISRPSKQSRTPDAAEYFGDPQNEVQWCDIQGVLAKPEEVTNEERGWIIGKVSMKWPSKDPKIMLEDSAKKMRMEVKLTTASMNILHIDIHDTLKFSLRDAKIELKNGGSSSSKMPFLLTYSGHVHIMYITKHSDFEMDGRVVDTKPRESTPVLEGTDWYATPAPSEQDMDMDSNEDACRSGNSSPAPNQIQSELSTFSGAGSKHTSPVPYLTKSVTSTSSSTPAPSTPLFKTTPQTCQIASSSSRPERVRDGVFLNDAEPIQLNPEDRRQDKDEDSRGGSTQGPLPSVDLSLTGDISAIENHTKPDKKNKKSKKKRYNRESNQKAASPRHQPPARNPALDWNPGLKRKDHSVPSGQPSHVNYIYPPIAEVRENTNTCLIGVIAVDSMLPRSTKRGDLHVTLEMVDPSNVSQRPFKINCFAHSKSNFLPRAQKGEIILIRNVKISKWANGANDLNGTVYPDKLKWVAFDPSTGRFHHSDLEDVVKSDLGLGPSFNPFHVPNEAEIEYFVKLGQWWRAYAEEGQSNVIVCPPTKPPREHRLIGDMEERIFFDAIVEVIGNAFSSETEQQCLTISDYTPHQQLSSSGIMGQYTIQGSTDKIPQETLSQMICGSYWSVKNLRLKYGRIGYLECDFYDVKLKQLFEDVDEKNELFQDMLRRKKSYLEMCPPDGPNKGADATGLTCVSDLKEDHFCDIVAEFAHRSNEFSNCTDLYVTDYTANATPSYIPDRLKKKIGDRPAFVITVFGDRNVVFELQEGYTYLFQQVKICRSDFGKLKGKLNYANTNILKVSKRTTNEAIVSAINAIDMRKTQVHAVETSPLNHRHTDQTMTTGGIKEIRASSLCPNKFRIRARVVDYYPFDLMDFTILRCRKCKKDIHKNLRTCVDCDDASRKFAEWKYRFMLRLEDEKGAHLVASASDEGVIFLGGLQATDLRSEPDELAKLAARLRKICGPVIDLHETGEGQVQSCPMLDICLKSWPITVEGASKRAYAVTGSFLAD